MKTTLQDPLTNARNVLRRQNIASVRPQPGWCVLKTQYFYGPEERKALVRTGVFGDGNAQIFPDRKSALLWISETEEGIYRLSHNESSRPTFSLCRVGSRKYKSVLNCWGF